LQVVSASVHLATAATRQRRLQAVADQLTELGKRSVWRAKHVHKLRVCCKRWRSVVRLLPRRQRTPAWQQFDNSLRALAQGFGQARDQQVLVDTLQLLASTAVTADEREACSTILLSFPPPLAALNPVAEQTGQIHQLAGSPPRLPPALDKELASTLQRNYRQSRRTARQALRKDADVETLHRFRKRVKYLCYQIELLSRYRHPLYADMSMLGSMLGKIHDLQVLQMELAKMELPPAHGLVLNQLLRQQLTLLRKAVDPVCSRCFAEPRLQGFSQD